MTSAWRVQTKFAHAGDSAGVAASPIVHDVLRSPGQPLDAATREFMEPRFGHDLSHVRVHTDARAADSAQLIDARAYTVGNDLVFGAGQYAPGSTTGKELLAHELVHAKQQTDSGARTIARQHTKASDPTISTTDLAPKVYYHGSRTGGGFFWVINWHTNQKNGWIVQKIETVLNITSCDGKKLEPDPDTAGTYWETWQVVDGSILGGDKPGTDGWVQKYAGQLVSGNPMQNHKGTWKTTGTVYFESKLDMTKGGWIKDGAGAGVWFTDTKPKFSGAPLLIRKAGGDYSCCGDAKNWYHKPL
jgi:hypothetical protein